MNKKPIPAADAKFNDFQNAVCPYINIRAVVLGLDSGKVTDMLATKALWDPIWIKFNDPAQSTKAVKNKKIDLKKKLTKKIASLRQDAKRSVALTEDDRTALHLPAASEPHTHIDAPTIVPDVEIRKIEHLKHIINISNPEEPDSRAKPDGVRFIEVYKVISNTEPTSVTDYHLAVTSGRTLCTVTHELADVGKTAWYISRYVSPRGEAGPWSDAVSGVVA